MIVKNGKSVALKLLTVELNSTVDWNFLIRFILLDTTTGIVKIY